MTTRTWSKGQKGLRQPLPYPPVHITRFQKIYKDLQMLSLNKQAKTTQEMPQNVTNCFRVSKSKTDFIWFWKCLAVLQCFTISSKEFQKRESIICELIHTLVTCAPVSTVRFALSIAGFRKAFDELALVSLSIVAGKTPKPMIWNIQL